MLTHQCSRTVDLLKQMNSWEQTTRCYGNAAPSLPAPSLNNVLSVSIVNKLRAGLLGFGGSIPGEG
jgi:hypothetical protein